MRAYLTCIAAASLLTGCISAKPVENGFYLYDRGEQTRACEVKTTRSGREVSCAYKGVETTMVNGHLVSYADKTGKHKIEQFDSDQALRMQARHDSTFHIAVIRGKKLR